MTIKQLLTDVGLALIVAMVLAAAANAIIEPLGGKLCATGIVAIITLVIMSYLIYRRAK